MKWTDVPKVKTKSNSKGVLMMDITGADAAAWIVHTEDQIDTIAMTLRIATPLIYYNDIPDAQMNSRPNLKKLVSGESRLTPPLTVTQDTTTAAAQSLKVTIYSKGEKSRYEIYRRVLWIVSEPGNKFCVVDKPYHKSQAKEPAMAVCIDDATIFGHFNRIAQNVENCA
ncbi:Plancitoxin-1 [Trichinella spiralis]|uniref:Plancitoxin-1 n=1 Tax=Trichinella spiralis TaxID=6334 RepID=A0ABR3L037_TRISP